jgi:hypothetical protein
LHHGADPRAVDTDGMDAAIIATVKRHADIKEMVRCAVLGEEIE